MADHVRAAAAENSAIELAGVPAALSELLPIVVARATFLVMPSIWYETFGRHTIMEAFAKGTPVIASRAWARWAELVELRPTRGCCSAPKIRT
jgi:glycosyltransferase involved in cell wall biosynthesis